MLMNKQLKIPKSIKKLVNNLYNKAKEFKEIEKLYKSQKEQMTKELIEYLDENNLNTFEYETTSIDKNLIVTVNKRSNTYIDYDVSKLERKIDKETCLEFIDKEYTINDMDGLISYLKTCEVNPKIFKSFINVNKSVNKDKLEQQFQLGEISLEDLKGCYHTRQSKSFIDVKVKVE